MIDRDKLLELIMEYNETVRKVGFKSESERRLIDAILSLQEKPDYEWEDILDENGFSSLPKKEMEKLEIRLKTIVGKKIKIKIYEIKEEK